MAKTRVPAVGAEGWFTDEPPALVGCRCGRCGTVAFPPTARFCPNPGCEGGADDLAPAALGSTGTIWSYTNARYAPPPPYVARTDPYEPFTLAAVELDDAGLVVLGQVVDGVGVDDLAVGGRVELVVDTLFEDDEHAYTMWRWRPVPAQA
jgi:uncharacterized OB-fold protein